MQRSFLVPLVLALLAAAAYWEREPLLGWWRQAYAWTSSTIDHAKTGATPAPDAGTEAPKPISLLPKHAPPGIYYMLVRAKNTSPTGVKAVNPGEAVKLLERLPNNRMRVTVGNADFVVSSSDVTDDGDAATEADRRFRAGSGTGL